jgi:formate hydrogenlyase transcriptional activator
MNQLPKRKDTEKFQTILLVDDISENLRLLSAMLSQNKYQVRSALSGKDALEYLINEIPDMILLDIRMPEMDGFEVCRKIKANKKVSHIPIIFISALQEIEDKVQAFDIGGVDFITKPFQEAEVLSRVRTHLTIATMQRMLELENYERKQAEKALEKAYNEIEIKVKERTAELEALKKHLEEDNTYLQEEIKTTLNIGEIVGQSRILKKVLKQIEQVAPSGSTVLILGETGTGKELIARAIHNFSQQSDRPLVKVNCAALPANLIESELFGHEKGAFTGAIARKIGRFELAHNGTIFLDEIGDLPLELQAKLLRVLQEGEFERLGSSATQKVKVRILAATNRDLTEQLKKGLFREDLFYRLNVFPIESPPLRERKGDIALLVMHFIQKLTKKIGKTVDKVSMKDLKALQLYNWPGNIRELENVIERSLIISQNNQLQLADCLINIASSPQKTTIATLDEIQKEHILKTLELTQGRISGASGASKLLGIKSTTLDARIKKLGIKINT